MTERFRVNDRANNRVFNVTAESEEEARAKVRAYIARDGGQQQQHPEARADDSIPVLSDFNRFMDQIPHNMGVRDEMEGALQGARNIGRRLLNKPIERTVAQAMQQDRERGDLYAQENPGLNAASVAMTVPAMGGRPSTAAAPLFGILPSAAPRVGALQAGASAAAVNAPFALARQEGSLQERAPGAAVETAATLALGTALQGGANLLTRRAPQASQRAAQFQRAGVDPSLAAMNAGTFGGRMSGAVTNAIADNPIAGVAARPRIGRQMEQVAAESERIQRGFGSPQSPEGAGSVVQRGLRRYAGDRTIANPRPGTNPMSVPTSEWSVPAQADAIYDHVLRPVQNNPTTLANTVKAIRDIEALGNNDPAVLAFRADGVLKDITNAAHEIYTRPGQTLSLGAARELRRRLRIHMDAPQLAGGQDNASLARVYGALTDDIMDAAGPQVAGNLRKADRFYQQRMNRIKNTLGTLVNPADPSGVPPSQAFHAILRAADARRGDSRVLVALRDTLRPQEMRTLASSLLDYMGQPTAGSGGTQAAELGFSVNTFSTNWRNMSPLARRVLFGRPSDPLAKSLDDLAAVSDALKGVERTTNASGSGRYANIAATATGAVANMPVTLGALALGAVTGEVLTNPAFVRWLVSAQRASGGPGGARQQLAALATIAARDPALAPLYADLARRAGLSPERPASQPQRQLEPAR